MIGLSAEDMASSRMCRSANHQHSTAARSQRGSRAAGSAYPQPARPTLRHWRKAARPAGAGQGLPLRLAGEHPWLENLLERAFIFSPASVIEEIDIDLSVDEDQAQAHDWRAQKRRAAEQAEAESLVAALRRCRGNVSQVAEELGISARAVRMKLRTHALNAAQFR